jgi:hypothetical protein
MTGGSTGFDRHEGEPDMDVADKAENRKADEKKGSHLNF